MQQSAPLLNPLKGTPQGSHSATTRETSCNCSRCTFASRDRSLAGQLFCELPLRKAQQRTNILPGQCKGSANAGFLHPVQAACCPPQASSLIKPNLTQRSRLLSTGPTLCHTAGEREEGITSSDSQGFAVVKHDCCCPDRLQLSSQISTFLRAGSSKLMIS